MRPIGMRTIKTGLGVFLCLLLSPVIVQTPLYAAISCTMSIQTSVKGSIIAGLSRIKGTVLGGIIGFLATYYLAPNNAFVCGLGVIITIYLCISLNMKEEVAIATVTFLSINLGNIEYGLIHHSISRIVDNSVGVLVGICVNYLLARPNHAKDVVKILESISIDIDKFIQFKILRKKIKFDMENLEVLIETLEKTHDEFVINIDYEDVDDDLYIEEREKDIENLILLSRELYFHMQSIMYLEKRLYLSKYNYISIKELYPENEIDWELDDVKSPVFNYHLSKILSRYDRLKDELNKIGID